MSVQNQPSGVEPFDADEPSDRLRSALVLAGFLVVSFGIVLVSSMAIQADALGWFAKAAKSPLTLPFWAGTTFWTIVHVLASVAAWLVWRERQRRRVSGALSLYATQLVLTALWRPVLLSMYPRLGELALWLAAAIMLLLILTLITMIREFRHIHRGAALSLVPYLLWTLYAFHVNVSLIVLN